MATSMRFLAVVLCGAVAAACSGPHPAAIEARATPSPSASKEPGAARSQTIRWTGTLEAVRSTRVAVPQVTGPTYRMTLTRIVRNGAAVAKGDVIAEFDPLEQIDQARQSAAKSDDLAHQVRQRIADNAANAEGRQLEREQAEADLAKARLDVSKAPVLGEIEAQQNTIRLAKARAKVESLRVTQPQEERADRAALRILELQRDRQRAAQDRARANLEKLRVKAPLSGMVALSTVYNNGSMVRPQAGDQLYRNNTLLNIFDPGEMLVRVNVAEPDGALLKPGLNAKVYVDAYPDMTLGARFVAASPVAASAALGRGVKTFMAVFRLEGSDPRLMPDLSAAVVFDIGERSPAPSELASAGVVR
ncbi:MAG TPA: HlyD family efflux transporter periplasmic adaptor subunit [Vicinamibacterales bacterium]|jgi:multidrug resistance efflux pump